jgi:hypothetical protein
MPLNPKTPEDALLKFMDKENKDFDKFPENEQEVAQYWMGAIKEFFGELVSPALLPGTLDLAEKAGTAAMIPDLSAKPPLFPMAIQKGLTAFTATFTAGAAPPQIVAPPPVPYVFPVSAPTEDPSIPAKAIATTVLAWAITGTVTIPPAAPTPWS